MKIIKPSVEFFGAVPTDYTNALRFIEMAGRACYKSEDKITDKSAEPFVKRLIKSGHLAMVEHSNFVVRKDIEDIKELALVMCQLGNYLHVHGSETDTCYIGGSFTAWAQQIQEIIKRAGSGGWNNSIFTPFLKKFGGLFFDVASDNLLEGWQVCPHNEIPKELHRYSAKFICDRGVSHELVRHRPCSFAQESTRYVNYGGKDMEFVEPAGMFEDPWPKVTRYGFEQSCREAEISYGQLLSNGLKPQQARAVLPNALKTEIVVTADAAEWAHIKKLRTHPSAHPDMVRLMNMMPWEEMGL